MSDLGACSLNKLHVSPTTLTFKGLRITGHFSNFVCENVTPVGSSQCPLKYWQDTKGRRTGLITSRDQRDLWESKDKTKWEGKVCPHVDNPAYMSREHQPGGLVAEDSSHRVEVSKGESVGSKKLEGFWLQVQLLKWNWIFFIALQFNLMFCRW